VGITLNYARNAEVYNNTILLNGTFPYGAIEYRFSATSADIRYNLTDAPIWRRDGASGSVSGNVTNAQAGWFAYAATADLHLLPADSTLIDQAVTLAAVPDDFDGTCGRNGSAPARRGRVCGCDAARVLHSYADSELLLRRS
jgi:hypothetical protein